MRALITLALCFFFLGGALGLKTVPECEADPKITLDSQMIKCYHTAALTYAYMGDSSEAIDTCNSIWYEFGAVAGDASKVAELEYNVCHYDIAKIFRDPDMCGNIKEWNSFDIGLSADEVNKDMCLIEVCRLSQLNTENYYGGGASTPLSSDCPDVPDTSDNLCAVVFILPLLLIGVWKYS